MRVAVVSGSWPPDRCGVGDYAEQLAAALERTGAEVLRAGRGLGTVAGLPATVAAIRKWRPDVVHIQYPTVGYGRSLAPSLLAYAAAVPVVTTLHEFSIFRWYRWPWFALLAGASAAVIVSNEPERQALAARVPWRRDRLTVVPIGSNIPRGPDIPRDPELVCNFGLVMPGKGLEAFLTLVGAVRAARPTTRFVLIGTVPDKHRVWAERFLAAARSHDVALELDGSPDAVAVSLRRAAYAYLPFPDGATEKRGSLLAALVNGTVVLTPHAAATPAWIRDATVAAPTPAQAAERLLALMDGADPPASAPPLDWDVVVARHIELYRRVLGPPQRA